MSDPQCARLDRHALELIAHIASALGVHGRVLMEQASEATIVACSPTMIDVRVTDDASPVKLADGPVPGRFLVMHQGTPSGEILIWIENERLIGIEQAWYGDVVPTTWPAPTDVTLNAA